MTIMLIMVLSIESTMEQNLLYSPYIENLEPLSRSYYISFSLFLYNFTTDYKICPYLLQLISTRIYFTKKIAKDKKLSTLQKVIVINGIMSSSQMAL